METWLRVTYFLPLTTHNDRAAYLRVLDYIRTRHPRVGQDDPPPAEPIITGFSYTTVQDDPPPLHGDYWSRDRWIPDDLAILFLDNLGSIEEPGNVLNDAQAIKSIIAGFYDDEGSPQVEIWCTIQQIYLL